jgi:hypothetical protein
MNYLSTALICCALLLSLTIMGAAQKEILLKKCEATFGEPVDKDLNLFPLNNDFVVSVEFTKKGTLKVIAVQPKYFFCDIHPEWLEPDKRPHLLNKTPQALVSLIDSIRSLGTLKTKSAGSVITNSTNYREECYENAVITFADTWDWYGNPTDDPKVRFIRVNYDSTCRSR